MANRITSIIYQGKSALSLNLGRFILWQPSGFKPIIATGGITSETVDDEGVIWRHHVFSAGVSGFEVFDIPGIDLIEYLIVAGGGAGINQSAWNASLGGGGGGGDVLSGILAVEQEYYPLAIGIGGIAAGNADGGNSEGFGLTALGGGRGGARNISPNPGGSGGGGSYSSPPTGALASGLGNHGGDGRDTPPYSGGGGGGMVSAGENASDFSGGKGGDGFPSSISGTEKRYGAGGGGGFPGLPHEAGQGGLGGGGRGGADGAIGNEKNGQPGEPNTGSGGGGASSLRNGTGLGGDGANGLIHLRYPLNRLPSYW